MCGATSLGANDEETEGWRDERGLRVDGRRKQRSSAPLSEVNPRRTTGARYTVGRDTASVANTGPAGWVGGWGEGGGGGEGFVIGRSMVRDSHDGDSVLKPSRAKAERRPVLSTSPHGDGESRTRPTEPNRTDTSNWEGVTTWANSLPQHF